MTYQHRGPHTPEGDEPLGARFIRPVFDLAPGDEVAWTNDDDVLVLGRVSRTAREEPWLGRYGLVEVFEGDEPDGPESYHQFPVDEVELV